MAVTPTKLATPVVTSRLWASGLSKNLDGSWVWIGQLYNYPTSLPTEWVVLNLSTGAYTITTDSDWVAGQRGRYVGTSGNMMRAPNGRIFWGAISAWWWWFDPTTNTIHDGLRVPTATDGDIYSMKFNHDGSTLFGGTLATWSVAHPDYRPLVVKWDPTATPPVAVPLCRVGSMGHTHNAYAYRIWADNGPAGPNKWLYVQVGQDIWDLVAVDLATNTATTLLTNNGPTPWMDFAQMPEGLTARVYTNFGQAGQTMTQYWVVDGGLVPFVAGYNPATLPFTARDVTPYSNVPADLPDVDESEVPEVVKWRAHGSTGAYTSVPFAIAHSAPIAIDTLTVLPDGSILGDAVQMQGFFRHDPVAHTTEWYGGGPDLEEACTLVVGSLVWMSGYPNGILYKYDPAQPWTQPVGGRQGTKNPSWIGAYSDGSSFSGVKRNHKLAYSPAANRLYGAGFRDRSGFGGGIGYRDLNTNTFAGTFANLASELSDVGLVVLDNLSRVVFSGATPGLSGAPLIVYDYSLVEQARYTVSPTMTDTGAIFPTATASVLLGLSVGDGLAYRFNVATNTLLGQLDLKPYGTLGVSVQASDGSILAVVGGTLLRINPTTLAVTSYGATGLAVSTLAQSGSTIFAASGADLYRLDVTVDGGPPVAPDEDESADTQERRRTTMYINEALPQARTIRARLLAADGTALPAGYAFAVGDLKIVQPDGTVANATNLPVAVVGAAPGSFDIVVDQGELQQRGRIRVQTNNAAFKFWEWVEVVDSPPLYANDSRIAHLDADVSSRAAQASLDTDNTSILAAITAGAGTVDSSAVASAVLAGLLRPVASSVPIVGVASYDVGDVEPPLKLEVPFDGTNATLALAASVVLRWKKPDGTVTNVALTFADTIARIVQRTWGAGDLSQAGVHQGEVVITWQGGRVETVQKIYQWTVRVPLA